MLVAVCCFVISSVTYGQEVKKAATKYYLNVTSEKDGVKENISKTYDDRATMEKDAFFRELGIALPKGEPDKLVLETTIDDKKVSLSTMTFHKVDGNIAWVKRDDDVQMEILQDGKAVKVIETRRQAGDREFKIGRPFSQNNFRFYAEDMEGGSAKVYSSDQQVEVFAFEKDEDGHIKMDDKEADETIQRLEKLIEELKAAKKNND